MQCLLQHCKINNNNSMLSNLQPRQKLLIVKSSGTKGNHEASVVRRRRPSSYLKLILVINLSICRVTASRDFVKGSGRLLAQTGTSFHNELQQCIQYMGLLKTDSAGILTPDDYANFINSQSNFTFGNVSSFKDLPLELIEPYIFSACNCQNVICCVNDSNSADTSINVTKLANITSFCSDITAVLAPTVPTLRPTAAPSTNGTSGSPSVSPKHKPSPKTATEYPTSKPTAAPEAMPAKAPTKRSLTRAPNKPPFAPLNETSLAPASETPTPKPSKKTKPTAEPTSLTPNSHKPTPKLTSALKNTTAMPSAFISPINVAISFIGCNVNNYTIQEIKNGRDNELISTVEEALQNRSDEILSHLRKRSLATVRGNRRLVAFSNVSIHNVKEAECLDASIPDIISLNGSNCSSCLEIQSNVTLSITGKEGHVVQQDFEEKLINAVQSEGLGYPGFQDASVTPTPSQIPPTVNESSSNVNSAAAIGIAFAAFAGGYLVIMGFLALYRYKQRAVNTSPSTPPSPSKPSSEPQEKQDTSLKATSVAIANAVVVAKKDQDKSGISLKEFDVSFSSEPSTQVISSSVSADPGELVGGSTNSAAVLVAAALVENQRPKRSEDDKSSDEGSFIDIGTTDIRSPPRSALPFSILPQKNVLSFSTGGPSVTMPSDDVTGSSSQITNVTTMSLDNASGWEAVGVAAALMNEGSETSGSTRELRGLSRLSEYESSDYSSATSTKSSINEEQVSKINSMVEVGDWSGVVLAAKGMGTQSTKTTKKSKNWRVRRVLGGKSPTKPEQEEDVSDDDL